MERIKTLENGERYTLRGCGTNSYYYEISKEEYERIKAIENYRAVLNAWYEETMDASIEFGYGFYGCDIVKREDKYYYVVTIGNSCE